jgi:bidirectional [NiFe] hydrogenase diaphorase subunit
MKLSVVIDGKEVQVEKGTVLLKAARRAGIDIPALCYHDALQPYGACRLCLVEVESGGRRRITTSCNYPVLREGETVSSGSEKVRRTRRVVMELLLARCPGSRQVLELARRIGVAESRFPKPAPSRLKASEKALTDCILCGLCVRACEEAIGASAISFSDRGPNRRVASPFYVNSEACIGCGACAAVCPTGVIQLEDTPEGVRRLPFLNTEVALARCALCGAFFAPEPQLRSLRAKAPAVQEHLAICPACRMREFGNRLSRDSAMRAEMMRESPAGWSAPAESEARR